jgi:uncharacterized membrane protein HdeD (DUF308 family)
MNNKDKENLANSITFSILMAIALIACIAMYVIKFITDKTLLSPYLFSIPFFLGYAINFILNASLKKEKKYILYALIAIISFIIDIILLVNKY